MSGRSENLDLMEEEEDTAANCLMLISRVGESSSGDEKRVFRCKTCLKEFSSFQALGGHRASHKKPININDDPSYSPYNTPKATTHICPICGLEFPIGQALGGHMTKHRNQNEHGKLITRSLFPTEPTESSSKKSSIGKRLMSP